MMKFIHLLGILFFISNTAIAQTVDMATKLRAEGKIYWVIAVLLIVFLGIIVFLFSLDKRVKKLEKEDN